MYNIDFNTPSHIHFIGIGGISMSGLAQILLKRGFEISGSDAKETELTKELERMGARIYYPQSGDNLSGNIAAVVYTAAIHPDNPEFVRAAKLGLPMITRAEFLGQLMHTYETSVAISGTHGKTTTTSMLTHILLKGDSDPTVSVGGILPVIGGNIRIGSDRLFVTEACEYTNSFLEFFPSIEVILNIEEDHMDFFKDIEDIRNSFRLFIRRLPEHGTLIIDGNIDRYEEIISDFKCRLTVINRPGADIYASDIEYDDMGFASFILHIYGENCGRIALRVPGEHNVGNAVAAAAAAYAAGENISSIKAGLESFTGTERRFEKKGELAGGICIIDDYAHHPHEIEATLKAAANYPHKRIVCVFQPHTYSRTKAFLNEFAEALSLADEVVLADIYPARETDNLGVSSESIAALMDAGKVRTIHSFDEIENYLLLNLLPGDLCITMGAGDIVKVGERLLGR